MTQKAMRKLKSVQVGCTGGGLGGGWSLTVTWTRVRSGYVLRLVSDTSSRQRKRSSKSLTLKAVVEDCRRYPEVRVYGDFHRLISVEGLPPPQEDIVRLAVVVNEDHPVSRHLIDYLVVQSPSVLADLRKTFGPLWQFRALTTATDLAAWQEQLGLSSDLLSAGRHLGWKASQGVVAFRGLVRRKWVVSGFEMFAEQLRRKKGLARYWALEPRPVPNTAQQWEVLLDSALNEGLFDHVPRGAGAVPAINFLGWLISAVPIKEFRRLRRDHAVALARFSSAARAYVQRSIDPAAPAPGGYAMGGGNRTKQSLDHIHESFVSGRWAFPPQGA